MTLPFVDYAAPALEFVDDQPAVREVGPRLALIGEAPGADEARMGRPFVGRAGRLLDEALAAAGIERDGCLVGNAFRFRPPDNKVGHFFASRGRARKEGLEIDEGWGAFNAQFVLAEFAGEIAHLRDTLAGFAPAAVVALGGTPLWALTGLSGITKLRGRPLENRLVPGMPVVATWHPSFVLRGNRVDFPTLVADLRLAAGLAADPLAG